MRENIYADVVLRRGDPPDCFDVQYRILDEQTREHTGEVLREIECLSWDRILNLFVVHMKHRGPYLQRLRCGEIVTVARGHVEVNRLLTELVH